MSMCQLRIKVSPELSEGLRGGNIEGHAGKLLAMLRLNNARAACVFDEFCGYCLEAEKNGIDQYPLYEWTKTVIEDSKKKRKHLLSFSIYIDGRAVYSEVKAEQVKIELEKLARELLFEVAVIDTDPRKNPQPPQSGKMR